MERSTLVRLMLAMAALGTSPQAATAAGVSVTVAPATVRTTTVDGVQKVNFDLLLRNETAQALAIAAMRVAVFDRDGAFVTARELTRLGMRPGLETLGARQVEPGKTLLVFNPFDEFPASVPLASMHLTLELEPAAERDSDQPVPPTLLEVTVRPEPAALATALELPVRGRVLVWDGNDLYAHHRRFDLTHPFVVQAGIAHNISRYGLDLMMTNARGTRFRGKGDRNEDYLVFGVPVVAPAAGVVVDAIDGRPDSPPGQMTVDYAEFEKTHDLRLFGGNFLVIDHGHGELSYLAHLKVGSLKVKKGDTVAAGQAIAQVGSSGDSLEPHLHYQVLSGPALDCDSRPAIFRSFRRYHGTRWEAVATGAVDTGDVLESTVSTTPGS